MCDYSLEHIASRPAVVGDKLTVTRFPSCTTGFQGEDANVAVCLLPGTELAFDAPISKGSNWYGAQEAAATFTQSVAVFSQILRPEMTWGYHKDAIEMADGVKVLLNELVPGQTATVLQLPKEATVSHLELHDIEPVAPMKVTEYTD